MNTQPALPLSRGMLTEASLRARNKLSVAGMSLNGVILFVITLLVVGSGYKNLRLSIGGLLVHPYLFPVALSLPFVLLARLQEFPLRILSALLVFTGMYFFSVFNGTNVAAGEIARLGSGVVTIIVCALLVRRRGDFVAGSLGLCIAIAFLAMRGLQEENKLGTGDMEGANKNSYSLFALPAILLAGYIVLNMKTVWVGFKGVLVGSSIISLLAIFMSGNRSGYLGAVLVGLMLFWNRRGKGMLLVALIGGAVAIGIVELGRTAVFDQRIKQTIEGNKSDEHRRDILLACLKIGLSNPVIGVSPQKLPEEIGRETQVLHHQSVIESHNVFAHVFAGSGMICFVALLGLGWTMCAWRPRDGSKVSGKGDPLRDARGLLRMMVALWVVRGMFTREILYNPSFNIALGLAIGLCMLAEVARVRVPSGDRRANSLAASGGGLPGGAR